ncbi:hypothetical protein MMAGJ_02370 [Mycolicibacterium mageritense]|uniref:Uncharacterized protein n=1 Tax=Mycolicibacterium mageritense TaxID=53462 RepID=A0ABM7HKF0_MYCME|nr:hypothetical protein MMAGJ_02370 [Mycolicibacterium mageritense]CDO24705.1 hypothetical protein BN978_05205 [Mycolicibacterium mageritense DSM 44476 = CIP 104973]
MLTCAAEVVWEPKFGPFAKGAALVPAYTHVLEQDNKSVTSMGGWTEPDEFGDRLRRFDGADRFVLVLWALPEDMDYGEAVRAGRDGLEYLQAGGSAEALTD